MSDDTSESQAGIPWTKIIIGVVALAALIVAYRLLPISDWVESFRQWIEGLGPVGWVVFVVVYALTTFVLVPGSVLTLAAGVAFGLWGFPLVILGATLGSSLAFIAARYVFHDRVQEKVAAYPKFEAVNRAIGEEGWRVVGLLRLSPALPFSLQNWFLGLTPVGFWPAQIATFFGIMPGTLLYVWIGSLGGEAASGGSGETSTLKYLVFGAGILATLVVTILVTKKAKAKLAEIETRAD
ncbi:TVP38/TMEM64 family protein [Rhizobiaceae bacterium]|nr:TVP38/TMEM64 family protein [Rhizobiaceae bacterium]